MAVPRTFLFTINFCGKVKVIVYRDDLPLRGPIYELSMFLVHELSAVIARSKIGQEEVFIFIEVSSKAPELKNDKKLPRLVENVSNTLVVLRHEGYSDEEIVKHIAQEHGKIIATFFITAISNRDENTPVQ